MSEQKTSAAPEPWLRGPVEGVAPWLQPVAHALLQVKEDLERAATSLTPEELRARPGGAASVSFHLRHIPGSLDRLFGYARGQALTDAQRQALAAEREDEPSDAATLLAGVFARLDQAMGELRAWPEASLLEPRAVGRAGLPSTVLGLLFHAAEHAQRHTGQVIATAKVVRGVS